MLTTKRFGTILLAVLLMAGCARWSQTMTPPLRDHLAALATSMIRSCGELFAEAERRVDAAGVIDSEAARISSIIRSGFHRGRAHHRSTCWAATWTALPDA